MADENITEEERTEPNEPRTFSRRRFLFGSGLVVGGAVAAGVAGAALAPATAEADGGVSTVAPASAEATVQQPVAAPQAACTPMAPSAGYLVVDSKKCAGCLNCMMACSLAHEGEANPSLSRIQIVQDPFQRYPNDLQQYQCRQCATPVCVQNCPTGACHIDTAHGNVRVIDQSVCIGCQTCLSSCPQTPHRTIWNPVAKKASKCDLCLNTPNWGEQGGPTGKQACVEVCPMKAIKLVTDKPSQMETVGYVVNLRKPSVADLFMDVD
jgi:protein NrfC